MGQQVKKKRKGRKSTRISSKHQVTIPSDAFNEAGLSPGDTLQAEATGAGKVILVRVSELADRYSGALAADGTLRSEVEGLSQEWR